MASIPNRQIIEDLVRRSKEGDRKAFTDLLDIYETRLEVCVHMRLGKELRRFVEPDDVLQEVRLAAFQSIRKFELRGDGSVMSWLRAIAENVMKNLSRRLHRPLPFPGPPDPINGGEQDPIAKGPSALERMQRRERLNLLEQALRALSQADREIIILARVYALPMRKIAEQIGIKEGVPINEGAAGERLYRAVKQLRRQFKSTFTSWGLPTDAFRRLAQMLGTAILPGPPPSTSTP